MCSNNLELVLLGRDKIYVRGQDAESLIRATMDNTTLRYTNDILKVDWDDIMVRTLPFVSPHRKNVMLHVAGQFSINPLLLLAKVIQEQNDISYHTMMSDDEFRMSAKSFANSLSRYEHDFEAIDIKTETSSIEYSLRKLFNNDQGMIGDFLQICNAIAKRYDITGQPRLENPTTLEDIVKRDEEEIELVLPYASSECWQIGATHFGAQVKKPLL